MLQNTHGVTLEKINPNIASNRQSSWHSAAATAGYGTPTYRNSEYTEDANANNKKFFADPPIFSPDEDGYQDILRLNYQNSAPGYTANIRIFDSEGRQIKRLANNLSLSTEGAIIWDGITDDNKKATVGVYIIVANIFNPNGDTEDYKIAVTVAGRL